MRLERVLHQQTSFVSEDFGRRAPGRYGVLKRLDLDLDLDAIRRRT